MAVILLLGENSFAIPLAFSGLLFLKGMSWKGNVLDGLPRAALVAVPKRKQKQNTRSQEKRFEMEKAKSLP